MRKSTMSPKGNLTAINQLLLLGLVTLGLAVVAAGSASAQALVDWASIFNADGTVKNLCGGLDAVYLQDNISAGAATDMSVLRGPEAVVYNGTVSAAHDLGNGYAFATLDASNNLVIVAGVERLKSLADTYVEFEFNQDVVGVASGSPWPIYGGRTRNDLLVHLDFTAGILSSVRFAEWDGSRFATVAFAAPALSDGCDRMTDIFAYCSGSPVQGLPGTNQDVWDLKFAHVQVPAPDSFVQASVNVGALLGSNVEFTSIVIRSPEDISLGSFGAIGRWAQ